MTEAIHGQTSWKLGHGPVELFVTQTGGQMAPVRFDLGNGEIASPYSLAPWTPEDCPAGTPELLKALRGDFFCIPFGVSEMTPHPHGATANLDWSCDQLSGDRLVLSLHDPVTGADFRKELILKEGHRAVYIRHTIENLEGNFNYGHHPILEFPESAGACAIRTGPIKFGQVYPGEFEDPSIGGKSALKAGARFESLDKVALADGGTTSLASYPARPGFEDLVMFSASYQEFGWTAVHFPGYVWIAIRNCKELPSTLFWHSNGGRPYAPWNGQHTRRLGIEDVCSYFHEGAEISGKDLLRADGIATSKAFHADQPESIHHIQLVHPLAAEFGAVDSISRDTSGKGIRLSSDSGQSEFVPVDWNFLFN
jgi:hypothetical protein